MTIFDIFEGNFLYTGLLMYYPDAFSLPVDRASMH